MSGHLYCRQTTGGRRRWHAVIDIAPPGSPRQQVTRSFDTRKDAKAWLAAKAAQRQAINDGPLLRDWLHQWLDGRVALRTSTRASYRMHIERHLIPVLGDEPLAGLRPETIQRAHHHLLADGMTPATLARVHATLAAALNTAHRQGLLSRSPLIGVELPRHQPPQQQVWTLGQARAFLAAVRGDELEALWRLALTTGMRRGELLGLRWADVDPDRGLVRVINARILIGSQIAEGAPKTRAGRRIVHIDPQITRILRQLHRTVTTDEGRLFVSRLGHPVAPGGVSRRFTEICAAAGLPVIRFHDLRHTSATLGLAAGESLKAVSQRLGHADITITANRYLQVPDTTARTAVRELASSLDSPPPQPQDERERPEVSAVALDANVDGERPENAVNAADPTRSGTGDVA